MTIDINNIPECTCQRCGKKFEPKIVNGNGIMYVHHQKYCSIECRDNIYRYCKECGERYEKQGQQNKGYCSEDCKNKHNLKKKVVKNPIHSTYIGEQKEKVEPVKVRKCGKNNTVEIVLNKKICPKCKGEFTSISKYQVLCKPCRIIEIESSKEPSILEEVFSITAEQIRRSKDYPYHRVY